MTNQTVHTTSTVTLFKVWMTRQGRILGLPTRLLNVVRRSATNPAYVWNVQTLSERALLSGSAYSESPPNLLIMFQTRPKMV